MTAAAQTSAGRGPLCGVKVVACSTAQAGTVPYTLMADMGATVIKVETPNGGDSSRTAGERIGELSSFFETNNRGVQSLTLNLKTDAGQDILHRLVAEADVFGQNFRPGAAERNGFGYEQLKAINPALVYMSISGYGSRGPHANLPGTDAVGQALGGIAEAYAGPGEPMRTGAVSVADETCALLALGGLLAALYCAKTTRVGQKVETSLVGAVVRLGGWTLTSTMWRNTPPITGARINGTRDNPGIAASFNDRDGKPLVFQVEGRHWEPAMRALDFYATLEALGASDLGLAIESEDHRRLLLSTLGELFATGSRDEWVERLRAADIVAAPINSLLEVATDPDVLANGHVTEITHPELGPILVHGSPWQFSETPLQFGFAPKLGEHTDAILQGLGYASEDIALLRESEVV